MGSEMCIRDSKSPLPQTIPFRRSCFGTNCSVNPRSGFEIVRFLVGMDLSDDECNPWEREEPDAMIGMQGLNPEEEEQGPPDEEDMGDEQEDEQLVGKPTAPDLAGEHLRSLPALTPAVLSVMTPEFQTPQRLSLIHI